jgi:hypothetical protein
MQNLGALPGDKFSDATGTNHDGSVVVGNSYPIYPGYDPRPFLWTPANGMVDLREHLIAQGLDLEGWNLGNVVGISADGFSIIGSGIRNNAGRGWIIHLAWPADMNGDGVVDSADLGVLIINFNQGGAGDRNGDGIVDNADLGFLLLNYGSSGESAAVAPQQETLILQAAEPVKPVAVKK